MRICRAQISAGMLLLAVCGVRAADPVEMRDRLQLADGLFRRSLFDLAAREYVSLAETPQVPDRDNVLFRLAECYRRTGRAAEAAATYKQLSESFPDSPNVARADLQRALLLLRAGGAELNVAAALFEKLTATGMPPEVRSAALYHLGETLEKLDKPAEALARYEQLSREYAQTDYGMYAGLRIAWLLGKTGKPEDRRRAMGIYLDLAHKARDPKVAEEALFFAAQTALLDQRHEESANLFKTLKTKYPASPRIRESALSVGWANYYTGRYAEAFESLDLIIGDAGHPAREEVLYLRANCLRQLERRAEAVKVYSQQLEAFPTGRLAGQAGYEKLTTLYHDGAYEAVLKMTSENTRPVDLHADHVYWMNAEAALALQRYDAAVQYCRLLVDKCPQSPLVKDALYRLGWLLQKQEAWESASSWYLQVVQRFPDDPLASRALYASGVCLSRLGQSDAALRDWTALLTRYPECAEVAETLYQKAMEELRAKNVRAAAATLDERMRRFPNDARKAEVLFWRASAYRQVGEDAEAEKLFRACLAASPTKDFERESMLELGMLLQKTGRKPEAASFFQKLLDAPIAEKLGAERLAWLAEFQLEQKQPAAAIQAATRLVELKVDKGWTQTGWTLLGRVHRAKGERDPALHAFTEALATGASTAYGAESALRLGELLSEAGRFDDAEKHLTDAASRAATPDLLGLRAHAYAGLARNAERKGDSEAALRYHISVGILFDDPTLVPQSLHQAAVLLDKSGRAREAAALREELRTRYPASPLANPVPSTAAAGERKAGS